MRLIRNDFELSKEKIRYLIYNMAGLSLSTRVPKLISSRLLCRIESVNEDALLFLYKSTQVNSDIMQKIENAIMNKGLT